MTTNDRHKLMILDCNGLAHAVKHATKNLSHNGRRTGVLFGFMKTLLKLQETLRADNWLFAWDSSRGYLRQKEYPAYKANRAEKSEEDKQLDAIAYPQFELLRSRVLKALGFANVVQLDGFESDDIMAAAIDSQYGRNYQCVLVTRDKDMYQCLSERVSLFDPILEKPYTVSDLRGQWGCDPEDWPTALAIAGCAGDNVAGVAGVGLKTAIKFIQGQLKEKTKAYQNIISNPEMADRNLPLVHLPHLATPRFDLRLTGNEPTVKRMLAAAAQYDMRSLTSVQFKARWEEAFK